MILLLDNLSQSSTYSSLGLPFLIKYVTPGSAVLGEYFKDNILVEDIDLQNITMAVAHITADQYAGVMGHWI